MYQVKRASQSHTLPIRGLAYHLRTWGTPKPDVPPLVMVHGWMDIGASFQFMVDALADDRFLVLPHPEVAAYYAARATDTDRWLGGMRRLQSKLDDHLAGPA